jgi:hypothetical protein
MDLEIIRLWWWVPSPDKVRLWNIAAEQQDATQKAKPDLMHHESRADTRFSTKLPNNVYDTPTHPQ